MTVPPGLDQLVMALGLTCLGLAALERSWRVAVYGTLLLIVAFALPNWLL